MECPIKHPGPCPDGRDAALWQLEVDYAARCAVAFDAVPEFSKVLFQPLKEIADVYRKDGISMPDFSVKCFDIDGLLDLSSVRDDDAVRMAYDANGKGTPEIFTRRWIDGYAMVLDGRVVVSLLGPEYRRLLSKGVDLGDVLKRVLHAFDVLEAGHDYVPAPAAP